MNFSQSNLKLSSKQEPVLSRLEASAFIIEIAFDIRKLIIIIELNSGFPFLLVQVVSDLADQQAAFTLHRIRFPSGEESR